MKKPFMVECGDHRLQPMEIVCIHLGDDGMDEKMGFNIVDESHGVRVAICDACDRKNQHDPDTYVLVCRQCFCRIHEYQEIP